MNWREATDILLSNIKEEGSVTVTVATVNGSVLEVRIENDAKGEVDVVRDTKVLLDALRRMYEGTEYGHAHLLERETLIG